MPAANVLSENAHKDTEHIHRSHDHHACHEVADTDRNDHNGASVKHENLPGEGRQAGLIKWCYSIQCCVTHSMTLWPACFVKRERTVP